MIVQAEVSDTGVVTLTDHTGARKWVVLDDQGCLRAGTPVVVSVPGLDPAVELFMEHGPGDAMPYPVQVRIAP